MAKKVYISGPISGYDLEERKATFAKTADQLSKLGFWPVNPLENGLKPESSRQEHMRADIKNLLMCDMIYMLPKWEESWGARLEFVVATECGIPELKITF